MGRLWSCCVGLGMASLLLIAVPIRYNPGKQSQLKSQFEEYVHKFNKSYRNDPDEYEQRFHNFQESMSEIQLLNAVSRGPDEHRARFGVTHFSDMSKAEFSESHLSDEKPYNHPVRGVKPSLIEQDNSMSNEIYERRRRAADLPTKFDWRDKGYVGPIYNQGLCGACWAFTTVGAIETMAAIKTGKLELLSVQEMIDCAGAGNRGCAGGDICRLLEWLRTSNAAVQRESSYPLSGVDSVCQLKSNSSGVRLSGSVCGSLVGNEDKIISLLATHGPVAVAVNALTWQNYVGGVIQHHCGGGILELNHAVEIIGYDLTAEVPHYIARNSWGQHFGESGYVRLAVGSNMCGLANEVAFVDVTL